MFIFGKVTSELPSSYSKLCQGYFSIILNTVVRHLFSSALLVAGSAAWLKKVKNKHGVIFGINVELLHGINE